MQPRRLRRYAAGPPSNLVIAFKGKGKGQDTCYSAAYMSQTRDQVQRLGDLIILKAFRNCCVKLTLYSAKAIIVPHRIV